MLSSLQDPIAAIATAPGRGAVGIVRVSSKQDLTPLIAAICAKPLRPREASYQPFRDANGDAIDQGLALLFPSPHSYTGEHVLELQAHGGPVVLQLLLARCLEAGAELGIRLAEPGEFTQRAFLNGKLDLAQAEAVSDLIDASTEAAARSASRALAGALSSEVGELRDALIKLRMLVEATLDFPEEEIDFLQQADAHGRLARLQARVVAVLARTQQGALLREGIKVVIAGQPNVGKSSLLNALAGAELAIVTPIAGTTRDKVSQLIQIEGVPLHVVDTAGLREALDEVEKIGVQRAWGEIESADAVLFLHDLTRQQAAGPTDEAASYLADEAALARALAEKLPKNTPVIDVWNKADSAPAEVLAQVKNGVLISAKTGTGLQSLREKLLQVVGWQAAPEGVFMARERHARALHRVQQQLETAHAQLNAARPALDLLAEDLRQAQLSLSEITGAFSSDDLLGEIFSRFCIGK